MKRRNEVLVGVLTTVAILLFVVGTLWLARGGLSAGYPLYSRFKWGAGLKQGQPVVLAGVTVGYVKNVKLRRDGFLDVEYRISSKKDSVPSNSTAAVVPVGIFGDQSIALTPKFPYQGSFQAGDTVPIGASPPGIADILARTDTLSQSVGDVAKSIQFQLVQSGGLADLRATIAQTSKLVAQLNVVAAEQSRGLTITLNSFRRTLNAIDSSRVDSTVRNLQETTQNLAAFTQALQQTTSKLDTLMLGLQNGQGTAGKLLRDEALYNDVRALVTRVDSLTADFKRNPKKYINLRIF